jgi:hypothetical protein
MGNVPQTAFEKQRHIERISTGKYRRGKRHNVAGGVLSPVSRKSHKVGHDWSILCVGSQQLSVSDYCKKCPSDRECIA